MFDHHKKSPWFAEKYDPSPDYVALRTRVRKEGWKGRVQGFLLDLESGKFDPDLNETSHSSSAEHSSAAAAATTTTPGVDATVNNNASEDANKADGDEMQFNMEAEEDTAQEANGARNRRTTQQMDNRGEEIAVPPEGNQVMIRTIPPDIGRVKLEEVRSINSAHLYYLSSRCRAWVEPLFFFFRKGREVF